MKPIISVDFDGTIANVQFPRIIGEMPGAIETLKELQKHYLIIVWTCRNGSGLEEAVKWMEERGFKPDTVNANPKESLEMHKSLIDEYGESRKIFAHCYIDDSNFGGFPGWDIVRQHLLGEKNE